LLLTYPFPDSSLTTLNYRDAQTGGYGLFTNMTATLDLDLTTLLCRYGIDSAGGVVEVLQPEEVVPEECGQPGTPPGNQTGVTGGDGAQSSDGTVFSGSLLPEDAIVPGSGSGTGRIGVPSLGEELP
jgi:phospholipid/cholesterol/gamma-HCH transport system substrate-binding protein